MIKGPVQDSGRCLNGKTFDSINKLTDKDQYNIQSWEGDYISCDNLNMGCTVGEKWAIKQMSDPTSQLSKSGLKVCSSIADITGVSVYYYLFNYRRITIAKDKLRTCPTCNGEWLLQEKWLGIYDFKCDKCNLVSTLSSRS